MNSTRIAPVALVLSCVLISLSGCNVPDLGLGSSPGAARVAPGPRPFAVRAQLVPQVAHSGTLEAIAFSPDGRLCATGVGDYLSPTEIKIWDTKSWQVLRVLRGPSDSITQLGFSPDGSLLAAASGNSWQNEPHPVWLWNVKSGAVRSRLAMRGNVEGLAFAPDGSTLLTASNFGWTRWNTRTGTKLEELPPSAPAIKSFAVSPDGNLMAAGGYESLTLCDTTSGKLQKTVRGQSAQVKALAWSPDGKTLLSGGDGGTIRFVDVASGTVTKTIIGGANPIHALTFAPDGESFAAACGDGGMRIWKSDGTPLRTLAVKRYAGRMLAWTPGGKSLVGDSETGTMAVWNPTNGTVIKHLAGNVALSRFQSSPDGRYWATVAGGTVHLWDARAARVQRTLTRHTSDECCGVGLAFTDDSRTLATGAGEVRLWDAASGRLKRTIKGLGKGTDSLHFLNSDSRLLVLGSSEGYRGNTYTFGNRAYVWDARADRAPRRTMEVVQSGDGFTGTSQSPDGRTFAVLDAGGTARLWDSQNGKVQATLRLAATPKATTSGTRAEVNLTFSRRGSAISSDGQGQIAWWDAPLRSSSQPRRILQLKVGQKPWRDVVTLKFGPDEKTLITSGHDAVLRFWNPQTGQQMRSLSAAEVGVLDWSGFSPGGRLILTHGTNGTFQMRDARSGVLRVTLMTLPPPNPGQTATDWLAFTPQGYYDSSPGARRFITWIDGERLYPAAKFEKQFHRPDMLRKALLR